MEQYIWSIMITKVKVYFLIMEGSGIYFDQFLGKLNLEIGVYQKAPPIGGTFGDIT